MERVQPQPVNGAPGRRKSVFMEVGLVDEATLRHERSPAPAAPRLITNPTPRKLRPTRTVRFQSQHHVIENHEGEKCEEDSEWEEDSEADEDEREALERMEMRANRPLFTNSKMYRIGLLTLVLAIMLPVLHSSPLSSVGAKAGVIPRQTIDPSMVKRDDTNPDVCLRWSHQSAIVNGTLYVYGGRTKTSSDQTSDTWVNDFMTMDLTKSWQISTPSYTGLPKPSGPPEVANGYLWNSLQSLFLYGGEFSDDPQGTPTAFSTWEYQIGSKQWVEHSNPQTVGGKNAVEEGQSVQRSAEGAGFSVSTLGRGWYFGGHLDFLTTEGWNIGVKRIYLKSLVEFTFPGYSNDQVDSLSNGKTAGSDGAYRNITEGGMQETSGFTERADGLLLYVPGYGAEGILIGLTGGVNETFTQMNVIDVYDIANSTWYKQSTSGTTPKYRVNPCAVVAAAADGSSYNVYMYGGQNLQPAKNQTQYDDMWILSVPSFTWIEVDQQGQSVPPARAGHSCHVWDGQMIVVGGYVGQELSCDSPGIYNFNMSSLQWASQFTALTGSKALQAYDGSESSGNPLAQQANQRGFDAKAGLEGSYGYNVPAAVQSVIGGTSTGGATLTAPVQTPTDGPFQSGTPVTYTVTGPNGAIITETATAGGASNGGGRGTNVGAIVAGVIAGVFAIIAGYFAFCAWVYRKQVRIWKEHAQAVSTRANEKRDPWAAQGAIPSSSGKNSSDRAARDALFPPMTDTSSGGGRHSNEDRIGYAGAGGVAAGETDALGRRNSQRSSTDDLLEGQEPSFWGANGVLLNPRRSLRVINRD
ncbi:kelch repeat protein-like protein [Lophiostoma macrostomum CBS 122681]|uniref:Kelch repeat protein-like protein n=1 Tax=Lophiostoma macrostomum CBS 122681 TaxID=1314788 RepID=A0A6A6T0D2_9PLEO|nr:kelch repeat protein-like protein [Lophiostoma macrostomum CBS 122681]